LSLLLAIYVSLRVVGGAEMAFCVYFGNPDMWFYGQHKLSKEVVVKDFELADSTCQMTCWCPAAFYISSGGMDALQDAVLSLTFFYYAQ